MFETLTNALVELREALAWAPDHVVGALILALAAVFALSIHGTIRALFRRLLRNRPYARSLLGRTTRLTQTALLVIALFVALPATPFDPETTATLARILLMASIALLGWLAITIVNTAVDIYLLRFRLDVADNLLARKHVTQMRVLMRVIDTLLVLVTAGAILMTFESVRQYGVSLFASAGVAGLIAGLAARPVLTNLFAGIQIAMTQPIRIEDAVIVEKEWGWVEEITTTYVVVRLWDLRRMIVPLSYFIEKPFQNWTREGSAIIGSVLLYLDYSAPIDRIRQKAAEIASQSSLWDRKVNNVQVTDCKDSTIEVRVLVSATAAPAVWDLRCELREKLIAWLQQEHPGALPRRRQEIVGAEGLLDKAEQHTLVPKAHADQRA
jgi:small-conductance mechanosensitive channel